MTRPARPLIRLSCTAALALACVCASRPHAADASDAAPSPEGAAIAARYHSVFTAPPRHVPTKGAVDGPILGNGSLLAAMGGPPENLRFHINQNDLWTLTEHDGSPKPLAVVALDLPEMKGASYRVEQAFATATTTGTFVKDGTTLSCTCAVDANENLLWIRLEAQGKPVAGTLDARLPTLIRGSRPPSSSWNQRSWRPSRDVAQRQGDILTVARFYEQDVRVKTGVALAARVLGGGTAFTVAPGKPVWIAVRTASVLHTENPQAEVLEQLARTTPASLQAARTKHEAWWRDFWSRSFIEIPDKLLEQRYYLSQYGLASASRDPEFPPGLFGWVTNDFSNWTGCYFLNYNFVSAFYGVFTANHLEQGDPATNPFVHVAKRMETDADLHPEGVPGIFQSRVLAPLGSVRAGGELRGKSPEQKSNGAYSCVPIAERWYATYDLAFARKTYPYVKGVATFWEHWLKFEDGRYNIYDDPIHEGSGPNKNGILSLGLCRMVMNLALDMSRELGVDADRRDKWTHIHDHLPPYPTQPWGDRGTIFRYTETGPNWWKNNTLGIQHIFPAGGIGLGSSPELIRCSHNTITAMRRWQDANGMNSLFAAAARTGYDPATILHQLRRVRHGPNGMVTGNAHGMEHFSIVPNALQEMLMQSHEGVIRFFPCWPGKTDARFGTLRARGAFLISAALEDGEVIDVKILGEKGRDCTVQNPWPGKSVRVVRDGKPAETVSGERFTLKTQAGEQLALVPQP